MLRKAQKKDIPAIKKLVDFGSKKRFILPRSAEDIKNNIDSFFVYLEKGKIAGCCSLDVYNWKLAEIRSLVVQKKHQGKGIGGKLVRKCLDKAKKLKIYKVLSVTKEDLFFNNLGFEKCLNGQWPMFIRTTKRKGCF